MLFRSEDQLSLAIGKKGQNVRLASKLLGWQIEIKSEEEKRREVEAQFADLEVPSDDLPAAGDKGAAGEAPATVEAGGQHGAAQTDASEASAKADGGTQDVPAAEPPAADVPVPFTLAGIGEKTVRRLADAGFTTVEAVAAATADQLSEIPGIGGKTAEKVLAAARGEAPASGEGSAEQ